MHTLVATGKIFTNKNGERIKTISKLISDKEKGEEFVLIEKSIEIKGQWKQIGYGCY